MDWSVFERWRLEQKNTITTEKGFAKSKCLSSSYFWSFSISTKEVLVFF